MYEKAPANIQISHPLSNGVIADINNMERLIHLFISDMSEKYPSGRFLYRSPDRYHGSGKACVL